MAATWIKMRTDLRNHPKVVRMASALKADRLRVIGGLWAVWATFDTHSTDGLLEGYTLPAIDDDLGWRNFAAAMQAVGWLHESESGLAMPRFDEHNGTSAKRRAQDTDRKNSARDADKSANGSWKESGQVSARDADKLGTREELEKKLPSVVTARASAPARPPDVSEQVWSDWLALRKAKKAPVSETVLEGAKREAVKAEMPLEAFLRAWCTRGSQGLQADWLRPDEKRNGTSPASDYFAGAR